MIEVNKDSCNSCKKCEDVCPFEALEIKNGYPEINENCKGCNKCVKCCPEKALHSEKIIKKNHMEEYKGFWVIGLETENQLSKVTLQLLSEARRLADRKGMTVSLAVIGKQMGSNWKQEAEIVGCQEIILLKNNILFNAFGDNVDIFTEAIQTFKPEVVLFPATVEGRDLAPKIACRLQTGLTADCTGLDIDENGNLIQIRPTYGGSIMAQIITPNHRPQMASIRPNVMQINKTEKIQQIIETEYYFKGKSISRDIILEEIIHKDNTFGNLDEANVIIAGGYGLGSKESFKQMFELCNKLHATAAATRKAVDEGWAPAEIQVGQTGKTVAPILYIAFGISGAFQHTLGMNRSNKIVAINNDPAAPIFSICDLAIVGDAAAIINELCNNC